ncbi:MAG: hypothetical protein ACOYOB_18170 [Myxococcota bacterium]
MNRVRAWLRQASFATVGSVLLLLFSAAYFALWACAPMAAMPPMLPLEPKEGYRIDLAAGVIASAHDELECFACDAGSPGMAVQMSAMSESEVGDIGVQLQAGTFSLAGVGLMARLRVVNTESVVAGVQVAAGWLYGAASLPISIRVADRAWLYTAPSGGYQVGMFRLPLGIALTGEDTDAFFETGLMSPDPTCDMCATTPYFSAGMGWRL